MRDWTKWCQSKFGIELRGAKDKPEIKGYEKNGRNFKGYEKSNEEFKGYDVLRKKCSVVKIPKKHGYI